MELKEVKDLYSKNYKMLMKEIKDAVQGVEAWFVEELKKQGYEDAQELVDSLK